MIYGIYQLITSLFSVIIFPIFQGYSKITGRQHPGLRERLGFYNNDKLPPDGSPVIWLHGASVGEVLAAKRLAAAISSRFPGSALVVSTVTEQGYKVAVEHLGNQACIIFAPLDLPGAVSRAADAIRPDIYICLETELWPNLLTGLKARGTKLFLLNARLSERSYRHYRLLRSLTRQVLSGFDAIAAITAADAERLISLGASKKKITVTGNAKYDQPCSNAPAETRQKWREVLGVGENQPVLVAGSTHGGEERMLLDVFRSLESTMPELVLIIAPRHLNRLQEVSNDLQSAGADHDLLSLVMGNSRRTNIVIVDTMGELAELYSLASFIFCGGSLVPKGGHNIMEAAAWSVPIFYGPSMGDFADARQLLESSGSKSLVENHLELTEKIKDLYRHPDLYAKAAAAAGRTARSQQGAIQHQLEPVFDAISSLCSNNAAIA